MTSKQRVYETIMHREPDRVPVGEYGIDHDHVEKIIGRKTYWRNRKDTTLALWQNRRDEVVEGMKRDCDALVRALDYDVVTVDLVPPKSHYCEDPPRQTADGVWEDGSGNVYRYAQSNDSITCMTSASGILELTPDMVGSIEDAADRIDDSAFELVDFICEKYGNEKAVLFRGLNVAGFLDSPFGGDFCHSISLSLLCPEEVKKLYGACFKHNRAIIERCRRSGVMIALDGHDFGMNIGCIISPACIRDVYFPAMKAVNGIIAENGMLPFFHCCGNIWEIMDDYIDAGYVGFQSIQESAGMDTKKIKRLYGDRLTLWTGIQCETLVSGTPADVRDEVENRLEALMPGGGFIFGSTNSVQYGAKTENYLAALDVLRNKGRYR